MSISISLASGAIHLVSPASCIIRTISGRYFSGRLLIFTSILFFSSRLIVLHGGDLELEKKVTILGREKREEIKGLGEGGEGDVGVWEGCRVSEGWGRGETHINQI